DPIQFETRPELKDPVAIVAFAGWNDASNAATGAARFLARRLAARKFASIDPEPFFDFTSSRPNVRVSLRGARELDWPANDFYYARTGGEHDILLLIGTEPGLRWRTFATAVVETWASLGVTMAVSLGALLADIPHTREVRVTGTAADPALTERLGLATSRYEGPTGIVGVLHTFMRDSAIPAASLWANTPHYLTTDQNPPAMLALIERLQPMVGLDLDLEELVTSSDRWRTEVDAAIAANDEIAAYVTRLEENFDSGASEDGEESELPPSEDIVLDVEEFLRLQRDDD
ncbi:MAG: PAC2 family protein, partial [Dehalococcoidia bacterium]